MDLIKKDASIPAGLVKDEVKDGVRKIVLYPYVSITTLLIGYVLTGLIFAVIGIIVLIIVGVGILLEENFSMLSILFFIFILIASFLLHFYVVRPARRALRPYVTLSFEKDFLKVEQIFPEIVRPKFLSIPYSSIKGVKVFDARSLGYRVGILCDKSIIPRTEGVVYLGSFGEKQNAEKIKNYVLSILKSYINKKTT